MVLGGAFYLKQIQKLQGINYIYSQNVYETSSWHSVNQESSVSAQIANWKEYVSPSCPITISYPESWKIVDFKLEKGIDYTGNSLGCFKITSPEYVATLGEESGGRIDISKLALGSTIGNTKINNFDDYLAVLKKSTPVTNLQNKQYNMVTGEQYITSGYFAEANFAFVRDTNLYFITWNSDSFSETEQKLIDQILSTFKFTN